MRTARRHCLTTLSLAMSILAGFAGCAPARPAPGTIAPATVRATNGDAAADLRTLDAWEARRAALVREDALLGPGSPRAGDLALAGTWLAFARDAYIAERRSNAADEAFAEARRLIERMEAKGTVASAPVHADTTKPVATKPVAIQPVVLTAGTSQYPRLWSRAQALADGKYGTVVRQLVAEVELELARAAAGAERDSLARDNSRLASAGEALPEGAVPMRLASDASRRGSKAVCTLAPHLARAEQLVAAAEARVAQAIAKAHADSLLQARLAFLADIRNDDRVRTRPVHFALDKDVLSPASRALLDKVSGALKAHPELVVVLEGHTDPRGSVAYNLDLSRRRATAVRDYLRGTGLDVSRVEVKGFGLAMRKTEGTGPEAYALDRRVMVRFSMDDGTPIAETDELLDLQIEAAQRALGRTDAGARGTRATARSTSGTSKTKRAPTARAGKRS